MGISNLKGTEPNYLIEILLQFVCRVAASSNHSICLGHLEPILGDRKLPVKAQFLETLKSAAMDRSPIVRRVAGEMLIRELDKIGHESLMLARLLASDPSASVAERGKFALKKLGSSAV